VRRRGKCRGVRALCQIAGALSFDMAASRTQRCVLLLASLVACSAVKELSTGFDFPRKHKLGALRSLGVRKKGPIKVYAVGMYEDMFKAPGFVLKMSMGVGAEKMTNVRRPASPRRAGRARRARRPREPARRPRATPARSRPRTAPPQALVDAIKPRCSDAPALDKFSELMLNGLPDGCKKNMELCFGTSGGKLALSVGGKAVGSVASKPLAKAFAGVYCDRNAVCTLKPVEED